MDDSLKIKVVIAIIAAIISGSGAFIGQEAKYGRQIENLSRESEQRYARIVTLENRNNTLQSKHTSLKNDYNELKNSYDIVYAKYQKCISSTGANYPIGSLDFCTTYQKEFCTNDVIEFEMMSASIFVKIKRISKLGPVIEISGCDYYLTENGINSTNDGIHAYYLPKSTSFLIKFSLKSCTDGNARITEDDIEVIEISVIAYDVDEQKTKLEYKRMLYKK